MTVCQQFCRKVQGFFKAIDLFATTELLRFKGQPDYSTATGGCTSAVLVVLFAILFASQGLATMGKDIIFVSTNSIADMDPPAIDVKLSPEQPFMFAVSIEGTDLNDPNMTYFNLSLSQNYFNKGSLVNSTDIPLVPCTEAHWNMSMKILRAFQVSSGWKCPPLDHVFTVGGKKISQVSSQLELNINTCDGGSTCATAAQLQEKQNQLHQFRVMIPVGSTLFNAQQKDYHFPIYEDRNEFTFTLDKGVEAAAYIQEVVAETDQSILPYEAVKEELFLSVAQPFRTTFKTTSFGTYVRLVWSKSPMTMICHRSFNKVDEYLAYVGGLIGAMVALLFIMSNFSEKAYGVSLASSLYQSDDGKPVSSNKFHFFYTVSMAVRDFLCCQSCQKTCKGNDNYTQCIDQMDKQLDISIILRRIVFLEQALTLLIPEHQLDALHLSRRKKLSEVTANRKKYELADSINNQTTSKKQPEAQSNQSGRHLAKFPQEGNGSDKEVQSEVMSDNISAVTHSEVEDEEMATLRQKVMEVFREAERGNRISQKIVDNINTELLWKLGFADDRLKTIQKQLSLSRLQSSSLQSQFNEGPLVMPSKTSIKSHLEIVLHAQDPDNKQ